MQIRSAFLPDVPQIAELYRTLHGTYKDTNAAFDEESIEEFIVSSLETQSAKIVVAEKDGIILGLCTFFIFPLFFNKHVNHSSILTLWVDPLARGQGLGNSLVEEYIRISKINNCTTTSVGIHHTEKGTARFFENQGFRVMDNVYIKELT